MNEGVRIEVLVKDMIPFKFLKPDRSNERSNGSGSSMMNESNDTHIDMIYDLTARRRIIDIDCLSSHLIVKVRTS